MATMKVIEIVEPNGAFSLVERPIRDPGPGEARSRVEACGICHSDTAALIASIIIIMARVL